MPILMRHDTVLRDTYGEYFLAELIEAQDEENQAAVCEVGDLPTGHMLSKINAKPNDSYFCRTHLEQPHSLPFCRPYYMVTQAAF